MDLKYKFFIFFIIVLVIGFFIILKGDKKTVLINDVKIQVAVAYTLTEQVRGLGGRKSLAENQGMLFVYNDYQQRNFWMKDMLFPIDIIWIKDNTIVGIVSNAKVTTNENLIHYASPTPVNYVLEINAGAATKNNFKIGDKIKIIN